MTLTPPQRAHLEKLRRRYRVQFDQQVPHSLSSEQLEITRVIRKLGSTKYDEYNVKPEDDYSGEPWKLQAKELALQLTEQATRCNQRDEFTWRFHCEPIVFARGNADVACSQCRKRLWRSEIEATREDNHHASATLRARQANRQPCRCLPSFRSLDRLVHLIRPKRSLTEQSDEAKGVSKIFTHRIGEEIIHTATIEQELSKRERPDCIYGLRETRNFDMALQSKALVGLPQEQQLNNEKLVIETIKVSPVALDGDRLLFPFLFLEAKSGKATDDWHSIKLQTCFPIRTALEIQQGLQRANGSRSRWKSKPTVWFLMYKGEDWRLCAAFTGRGTQASTDDENSYHILDLWSGSISNRDGALQLILLVDYIFDWARDIYRPAVLTEIRMLASEPEIASAIYTDTDIYSTREMATRMPYQDIDQPDDSEIRSCTDRFHASDSKHGIIRHAAFAESRFRAIFITSDNVSTMINSLSPEVIQPLLRKLLSYLSDNPLNMEIHTLDEIEKHWTGHQRFTRAPYLTQSRFFTVLTFAAYFSPTWDHVRELSLLAIAEDAFETLVEHSGLRHNWGKAKTPTSVRSDTSTVIEEISKLRNQPRTATLMAAITRVHRRLRPPIVLGGARPVGLVFERYSGDLRGLVSYVYSYFKKGSLEPSEPFLRVSDRWELVPTRVLSDVNTQDLEDPSAVAALIHGRARQGKGRRTQSDICMFLLKGLPEAGVSDSLAAILKNTFENSDVYHTIRDNRVVNARSFTEIQIPWNLTLTYGVYTKGQEFVDWIVQLDGSPPERQGCPRDRSNGQYLLGKNFSPWHEGSRREPKSALWAFLNFKIMTKEIRYWRAEAKKRKEAGISCCSCCAATDAQCKIVLREWSSEPEDVCWLCDAEIHEPEYPRWVWDAMLEELPSSVPRIKTHPKCNRPQPLFLPSEEALYKDLSRYPGLRMPYDDIREAWDQATTYSDRLKKRNTLQARRRRDGGEERRGASDQTSNTNIEAEPSSDPIIID